MRKYNQDIRQKAKNSNVLLYEVANALGVCDMTLSRRLRYELPQSEKDQIFAIIDQISNKRESA